MSIHIASCALINGYMSCAACKGSKCERMGTSWPHSRALILQPLFAVFVGLLAVVFFMRPLATLAIREHQDIALGEPLRLVHGCRAVRNMCLHTRPLRVTRLMRMMVSPMPVTCAVVRARHMQRVRLRPPCFALMRWRRLRRRRGSCVLCVCARVTRRCVMPAATTV